MFWISTGSYRSAPDESIYYYLPTNPFFKNPPLLFPILGIQRDWVRKEVKHIIFLRNVL